MAQKPEPTHNRILAVLATLGARLVVTRVPLLGLLTILALAFFAAQGVPTVTNAFITDGPWQLAVATFVCVLAVALLGNTLVTTWQLAGPRFGIPELRLPIFLGQGFRDVRTLLITAGLALVLVVPLSWILFRQAVGQGDVPAGWATVGLIVGFVIAAAVIFAVVFLVRRRRDRPRRDGALGPLDRILRRLGPGYFDAEAGRALPGHKLSLALTILLLAVYLFFYLCYSPESTAEVPSALSFLLVWLTLICLLLAGVAFFFDRWRIPLLLLVILYSVAWNAVVPRSHEFEIFPATVASWAKGGAESDAGDIAGDDAGDHEVPALLALRDGTLTVVAADGGGIQAAAWSTRVLTGLQDELGDVFTDSLRLVSSVSGGSVGTFFYLDAALQDGANGPAESSRDCVRRAAAASSLEATAWGLLGPDFRRVALPPGLDDTRDRGWALERAFVHNAARMRKAMAAVGGIDCAERFEAQFGVRSDGDEARMSQWRRAAAAGTLPGVIFNATFVDSGRQAFFSSIDPSSFGCTEEPCRTYGELDLRAATAARLSATFPYVSPVSRPSLDGMSPERQRQIGKWSVADGGYFDNFGAFALIRWLDHNRAHLDAFDRVVFLQILTFPATRPDPPDGSEGLANAIAGPLTTLLAVRTSSQLDRSRVELDFLERSLGNKLKVVELRPPDLGGPEPPLSWHLSKENVRMIERQWQEVWKKNQCAVRTAYGQDCVQGSE